MARGIEAAWILIAIVLGVSFMASIGAYSSVAAADYSTTGGEDVNRIIEVVGDQGGSITGVAQIDPFISLAIGALDTLQIFWIIITDTSELFVLLGFPQAFATQLESIARIAFGLTFLYMARGVVLS